MGGSFTSISVQGCGGEDNEGSSSRAAAIGDGHLSFSSLGHTIFDAEVFKFRRQAFLPALGSYLNTHEKRNSSTQLDRDLTVFLVLTAEALGICTHYLSDDILIVTVLDKISQLVVGELIEDKAQLGEQASDTPGTSSAISSSDFVSLC